MDAKSARLAANDAAEYSNQFAKEQLAKKRLQEDAEIKQAAHNFRSELDLGVNFLERLVNTKLNEVISCGQTEFQLKVSRALLSEHLICNHYLAFRELVDKLQNQGFSANYFFSDNNFNLNLSFSQ